MCTLCIINCLVCFLSDELLKSVVFPVYDELPIWGWADWCQVKHYKSSISAGRLSKHQQLVHSPTFTLTPRIKWMIFKDYCIYILYVVLYVAWITLFDGLWIFVRSFNSDIRSQMIIDVESRARLERPCVTHLTYNETLIMKLRCNILVGTLCLQPLG